MPVCKLVFSFLILGLSAATTCGQTESSQSSGNLLNNASFEDDLAANGLPTGWTYWSGDDASEYRSEVVEGGPTGKKSLKLEGKGIRGVVFANGIKIERNKRYALRGWAKVEGNKNAKAIIKFNYFHDRKWLGLADDAGVAGGDGTWNLLAKTDRAIEVPDASYIWISCVLEGTGTAWFDDLELVSYDIADLPENFETELGRSNRPAEFQVLERRLGTWDTEQTIKPGAWVPGGNKSNGSEIVEWTLDQKFIQTKY
ncbi:MAG: carbohydrate binding domain-containing protein, partial [Planctomycetota bacterium]